MSTILRSAIHFLATIALWRRLRVSQRLGAASDGPTGGFRNCGRRGPAHQCRCRVSPTAIFQSIDLREPPRTRYWPSQSCRPDSAAPHGLLPPEQEELQDDRQPERAERSRRRPLIPPARAARPDDHRGDRLLGRFQDPKRPAARRARAARIRHAGAAAEGLRDAADAGLVRPARGSAANRQGADVLHRRRRDQPVRAADRRPAGGDRPRRAQDPAGDRHRRRADPGGHAQFRRGQRRRPLRLAARR